MLPYSYYELALAHSDKGDNNPKNISIASRIFCARLHAFFHLHRRNSRTELVRWPIAVKFNVMCEKYRREIANSAYSCYQYFAIT